MLQNIQLKIFRIYNERQVPQSNLQIESHEVEEIKQQVHDQIKEELTL